MSPNCYNPKCLKKNSKCNLCISYFSQTTPKLVMSMKVPKRIKKTNCVCKVCNQPFYESPVLIAKGHGITCSLKCRRKLKLKTCLTCKKKFRTTNGHVTTCSKNCLRLKVNLRSQKLRAKKAEERAKFRSKAKFIPVKKGVFKWENQFLTLKNYKEPLTKIKDGYGWYGTIAITTNGSQIQCHICGKLVEALPGHIYNTHKINTKAYKEKFGLGYGSALVSENIRIREKQRTLNFLKTLTDHEKKAYRQRQVQRLKDNRHKMKPHGYKKTLEHMNKDGSCPDQTLDQIKKVYEKVGHVPSKKEFIDEMDGQRYVHLIYKHFGSWNKAIEMCKFNKENDHRFDPQDKGKRKNRYTDEELLEYLRIYAEENRQIPTVTDFRRNLLPNYSCYISRFGTIEAARRLAGVYDFVEDDSKFHKEKSKYFRHLFKNPKK